MRKLIFQMMISLDGYFEGPNRAIDWHHVDKEFNNYAIDLFQQIDLMLFGRITYFTMSDYWPTEIAKERDPIIADQMNHLPKIVFSKTLEKAEWGNTQIIRGNIGEEITKLKQQEGKNIVIFGSSDLAASIVPLRLIDEFRIIVAPIFLGKGKSLLKGIQTRLALQLTNTRVFKSGMVLMCYSQY